MSSGLQCGRVAGREHSCPAQTCAAWWRSMSPRHLSSQGLQECVTIPAFTFFLKKYRWTGLYHHSQSTLHGLENPHVPGFRP